MKFYFLLFIIYGLLGWVVEVLYVRYNSKHWYNRGFLHMPFLPIYAFGGLIITLALTPFKYNPLLIFIFGMILTSLLEYVTSVIMEELFATRWWDYSNYKYNLHGRICLKNSILFAILCLVVIYFINPIITSLQIQVPSDVTTFFINAILFALSIDLALTMRKLRQAPVRDIQIISGKIKAYRDGTVKSAEELINDIQKDINELRETYFNSKIEKYTKHRHEQVHLSRFLKIYITLLIFSLLLGIAHFTIITVTIVLLIINSIKLKKDRMMK